MPRKDRYIKKVNGKTSKMLAAEARVGKPLEKAIPELLNAVGYSGALAALGLAHDGDLAYWMKKFGVQTKLVAIPPGYRLVLIPDTWQLWAADPAEEGGGWRVLDKTEEVAHDD